MSQSDDRTADGGFVSRLILFLLVSVLCGLLVAGVTLPVVGRAGPGGPRQRRGLRVAARRAGDPPAAGALPHPGRRRLADRHVLRREPGLGAPHRRRPGHAPGGRRDRGLAVLRARRHRPPRHAARASSTTSPASDVQGGSTLTQQYVKQVLLESAREHHGREGARRGAARRPPSSRTPASCASCATRSPSRRSTPRSRSSSATSTSPTSAPARTASRRRPAATSASTPAT